MGRLILVATGILLAFVAGTACLVMGIVVEAVTMPVATSRAIITVLSLLLANVQAGTAGDVVAMTLRGLASAAVVANFVPVCLVAVIGEAAAIHSLRWSAGATGVVAAIMPSVLRAVRDEPMVGPMSAEEGRLTLLLFLAGVAAGGIYWLVAGLSAQKER